MNFQKEFWMNCWTLECSWGGPNYLLLIHLKGTRNFKPITFWVLMILKHLQPASLTGEYKFENDTKICPLSLKVCHHKFVQSFVTWSLVPYRKFVSHLQCKSWASSTFIVFKHDRLSSWLTRQRKCGRERKMNKSKKSGKERGNWTQLLGRLNKAFQIQQAKWLRKIGLKISRSPFRFVLNKLLHTYLLTPWNRVILEKLTSKVCS